MLPDPHPGWTNTEELLAAAVELLHTNNRLTLWANSKPGTQLPRPLKVPRPWEHDQKPKIATAAELARFLGTPVVYAPAGGDG